MFSSVNFVLSFKMIKFCLLFYFLIHIALANFNILKEWNDYKIKYKKSYNLLEDIYRRSIWNTNRNLISIHNSLYNKDFFSYQLAINQFSDMTILEQYKLFQNNIFLRKNDFSQNNLLNVSHVKQNTTVIQDNRESFDWRINGAVSPVRDQSTICNTGWAFASLSALESHHFIRFGNLPPQLSPQNLIDCTKQNNSEPSLLPSIFIKKSICNQQNPDDAFKYIIKNQNINTESSYPYEGGAVGQCRYNMNNIGATCAAFKYLSQSETTNEFYLRQTIKAIGPVIINYNPINIFNFLHYASGVYNEPQLPLVLRNSLNHYMVVTGYGNNSAQGLEYWIMKNSFGNQWGEDGYMRIARKNRKSIFKFALYPIV